MLYGKKRHQGSDGNLHHQLQNYLHTLLYWLVIDFVVGGLEQHWFRGTDMMFGEEKVCERFPNEVEGFKLVNLEGH